jgi:hypothetical protein
MYKPSPLTKNGNKHKFWLGGYGELKKVFIEEGI